MAKHTDITAPPPRVRTDLLFFLTLAVLGSTYVLLIVLLLVADILYLMRAPALKEVTVNFSNSSKNYI